MQIKAFNMENNFPKAFSVKIVYFTRFSLWTFIYNPNKHDYLDFQPQQVRTSEVLWEYPPTAEILLIKKKKTNQNNTEYI